MIWRGRHHWHRIRRVYNPKYLYQRMTRGYADCDCWSLDNYLADLIPGAIRHLAGCESGYPMGTTFEEWQATLNKMADGIELHNKLEALDYDYEDKELEEKRWHVDTSLVMFIDSFYYVDDDETFAGRPDLSK